MNDPASVLQRILSEESGVPWSELEAVAKAITDDAEMNRRMSAEFKSAPRTTEKDVCEYYAKSKTWLMQTYNQGRGSLEALARGDKGPIPEWGRAFTALLPGSGASVLDYGGGFLKDTWFLVPEGVNVWLAEIDGPVARTVRRFAKEMNASRISVLSVSGAVPDLGIHDGATCFECLEHMKDPVSAARKIAAAIRPGGPFAMSVSFGAPEHAPYHLAENAPLSDPALWEGELRKMGLELVWRDKSSIRIWRKC